MPKDPVCGMYVDEKTAIKKEIGGRTYYFCSESCVKTFENPVIAPGTFISNAAT